MRTIRRARTASSQQSARQLWGGRVSRRDRRVMLVVLSRASNLGGFTVGRVAQVPPSYAHKPLARMEELGWVDPRPGELEDPEGYRRLVYTVTGTGRARLFELLGLKL